MTLEQSPTIRGLRLGMSVEDVARQYETTLDYRPDEYGLWGVALTSGKGLEGLRELRLLFADGRLFEIRFDYAGNIKWPTIAEFTKRVTESLNLLDKWNHSDSYNAELDCGSFIMKANFYLSAPHDAPRLRYTDVAAKANAIKRKKEAEKRKEEEKRKAFKP